MSEISASIGGYVCGSGAGPLVVNRIFDRPLKADPAKILIVSFSNPGDVILSMPCYRRLQRVFPDAVIDIAVGVESEQLMQAFDLQGDVIVTPSKKTISQRIRFFSLILKSRYDLIVDLRNSYFGLAAKFGSGIFSPRNKSVHRRDGNLEHLDRLGIHNPAVLPDAPDAHRAAVGKPYNVSIAPGSKSDLKRYPTSSFAILADRLIEAGCVIHWVGSQSDTQVIREIQSLMSADSECLAGTLSWKEFRHHLESAHLLITNDSAPLHLADDIGCPVIALFGPTDHKLYGPQRSYSSSLRSDVACRPCAKAQCQKNQRDCLELISPETVFNEAVKILDLSGANQFAGGASVCKNKK
ncbi:MAG: glycosyltransferase family 9 protein, partial [Candidatus Omnitrophica bacterium]|nr:glycosyltransferase family 9 protein [Candidatus Omnitrophota bacterium]